MSQIRINFLNYNPDIEDTENKGLTVAQNVIHESEGYKEVHLATSTSFATTGGLAASTATILSCVAKPVGAGDDLLVAWISDGTSGAGNPEMQIGLNGVTATALSTGYPLSFSTTGASSTFVTRFDCCEYAGKIIFVAEGEQEINGGAADEARSYFGYFDYS